MKVEFSVDLMATFVFAYIGQHSVLCINYLRLLNISAHLLISSRFISLKGLCLDIYHPVKLNPMASIGNHLIAKNEISWFTLIF